MIDLRSDTATRPTPEMLAAMASAEVGDEQRREDPTVLELQRRAAELLGQETALFVPTATMANQIALRLHSSRGGVLIAEERTHVILYEAGGAAAHSGLMTFGLPGVAGRITVEQLRALAAEADDIQPLDVVVLENTHRSAGGRIWPLDELVEVVGAARDVGARVHLDGARIMNAAVATGIPAAEYGRHFDSVTICFSKGLGCPLGAVIATSSDHLAEAWRGKFLFGGAMRQAGVVAAAALHALDHHLPLLADDHRRARRLAEGLAAAGLPVDADATETNFVAIDVGALGLAVDEAAARVREHGVLVEHLRPGHLRAVTYLGVTDEDVERAIETIPRALEVHAPV